MRLWPVNLHKSTELNVEYVTTWVGEILLYKYWSFYTYISVELSLVELNLLLFYLNLFISLHVNQYALTVYIYLFSCVRHLMMNICSRNMQWVIRNKNKVFKCKFMRWFILWSINGRLHATVLTYPHLTLKELILTQRGLTLNVLLENSNPQALNEASLH